LRIHVYYLPTLVRYIIPHPTTIPLPSLSL
jgi:hypothetical protein